MKKRKNLSYSNDGWISESTMWLDETVLQMEIGHVSQLKAIMRALTRCMLLSRRQRPKLSQTKKHILGIAKIEFITANDTVGRHLQCGEIVLLFKFK
jgi:hypothetical protein